MNFLHKAVRTADWLVANQYTNHPDWEIGVYKDFDMNEDMNFGRFVRNYVISKKRVTHLSTNWLTGMSIYGLTLIYEITREQKYLDSAVDAAYYLKALQNVMDTNPAWCGTFSERITRNRWCAPRDAASAAWGLLRLYTINGAKELLNRTELFAAWHMNNAMPDNYPIGYYFFTDDHSHSSFLANCQGGTGLFYYDLYRVTGKSEYLVPMQNILDYYILHFINEDGSINTYYDPEKREAVAEESAWADMHQYNDDFAFLALLAATEALEDDRYLKAALKYINWVVEKQNEDGGFGSYSLSVSSCVTTLNLLNAYFVTGDDRFLQAGKKALSHLEKSVIIAPHDSKIHGAIIGMDVSQATEKADTISLRVTMYAIYMFILFHLEESYHAMDKCDEIQKTLLENPMFIGLKYYHIHNCK